MYLVIAKSFKNVKWNRKIRKIIKNKIQKSLTRAPYTAILKISGEISLNYLLHYPTGLSKHVITSGKRGICIILESIHNNEKLFLPVLKLHVCD